MNTYRQLFDLLYFQIRYLKFVVTEHIFFDLNLVSYTAKSTPEYSFQEKS